jgi:hypothetical protein
MPLVGGLCHVQRTSHSSMGVTTSMIMPLVGGLCHVQRTSTLWAQRPSSEDFVTYNGLQPSGPTPLVGGLCHVQRTSHSSMGVTTSKIMPLIGGLCRVQRTSTLWANAPHRRTLSRTTDFDPLGQRPSSEDFVTYNGLRTRQWE